MRYIDDNDPIKHRLSIKLQKPILRDTQQKLPVYFQEIQAARHKGRSWDDVARDLCSQGLTTPTAEACDDR